MTNFLIVIPCLNEEAHLAALLDQFVTENPNSPVVVADGGSTDRSREIAATWARSAPNVYLIDNPKRLQSAGLNLAVERLGGQAEWLVRVDAHCRYPRDYSRALIETARHRDADSVVVPLVTRGHSCFQRAAAAAQNSWLGTGGSPHRHVGKGRFVDHGHHALIRIDSFRRAGGYREDMTANEDAELDCRLANAGARIWLEPALAIEYVPRSTVAQLWRQYFSYGAGRARTLRLHPTRPKARQLAPLAVPLTAALALFAPLSVLCVVPFAVWLGLVLAAGLILGLRARHWCAMLAGIAAAVMHFAWALGFLWSYPRGRSR